MGYASIDALRGALGEQERATSAASVAYAAKMLHTVPKADSVDRAAFLLERVAGKRVLEFGASGPMHDAIVKASASCHGVDREAAEGVEAFDLDRIGVANGEVDWTLPGEAAAVDLIVCGEVLEHLSNPGWFLTRLRRQFAGVPVIITVPNAFSEVARTHITRGVENVNRDHVAWYSYKTLSVLLARAGYHVADLKWYQGRPAVSEGLIVVTG